MQSLGSDVAMALFLAMLLDAWLGEPRWLWSRVAHPAVIMGRAVGWLDQRLNTGAGRGEGVLALAVLVIGAGVLGWALQQLPGRVADVLVCAVLLAQKSLVDHVRAVADGLRTSLDDGRRAVAMIVSRDTGEMRESDVARSAIESAAENFSDGVIAPAFWFLVGGLPALLIYKVTNTADSMIGYRTQRHEKFGWAAARFDDVLNWIPARLTAVIIGLACPGARLGPVRRDARLHRSPNAGWPEAAMAYGLQIALSGPRRYDGVMRDYAFVNDGGKRELGADDIAAAIRVLWVSWGMALTLVVAVGLVMRVAFSFW
ncbi:adenosylcobinamide-phosphate synthase CbiB [Octadecabacter sp. R77987]|uniref:adenosylcobinamide-phosphate synthase CbiB n=1 Tax=Octadecabacter sp. R77987 TaxID=3093874 RepID=UPI00366A7241